MIGWEWDSAAHGVALRGIIACGNRPEVRHKIEQHMQAAGALSALAQEVLNTGDTYERTGAAMIATRTPIHGNRIRWRDVHDPAP